jgi:apolipoprotein D and lipocalin family protein
MTARSVDLERFMGDWYVIAHVPASIEKNATNAIESYELRDDGSIATTFRFNEGAFDGPEKVYRPRGFVRDHESNAVWGMRFIWPFRMEYRILFVDDAYERTVIGRSKRDYAWIMARTPLLSPAEYDPLVTLLEEEGYDREKLRVVPQERAVPSILRENEPVENEPVRESGLESRLGPESR